MNEYILNLLFGALAGVLVGIVITPLIILIYRIIKTMVLKMKIKKMLKQGKFLEPLDTRDYDYKAWIGKKYGNIDYEKNEQELKKLNERIFGKKQ